MNDFVQQYGYLAVFLGTCFEGEAALLLGMFFAYQGVLDPHWVMVAGFAGALAGDQAWFYMGRWLGVAWLRKHPALRRKSITVRRWIRANESLVMLGQRFAYGLRTVTPYMLGASRVGRIKCLCINALGAALWATLFGTLAMRFGDALDTVLATVQHLEKFVIGGIIGVALVIWLWHWWSDWRKGQQFAEEHPEMVDPVVMVRKRPNSSQD